MTNSELTVGIDLLHNPAGANLALTRPSYATDDFTDNGFVEFTHRGLEYHFDELEDIVSFVNDVDIVNELVNRLEYLESVVEDLLEGA